MIVCHVWSKMWNINLRGENKYILSAIIWRSRYKPCHIQPTNGISDHNFVCAISYFLKACIGPSYCTSKLAIKFHCSMNWKTDWTRLMMKWMKFFVLEFGKETFNVVFWGVIFHDQPIMWKKGDNVVSD